MKPTPGFYKILVLLFEGQLVPIEVPENEVAP